MSGDSKRVTEEQTPRVTEDSDKSPTAIDRLRMHLHDPETFDLDASDLESVVAEFEDLEASLSFRVDAPVESVKIDAEALGLNTAISEEAKSALAAIDAAQRPAQRVYAPVSQKEAGKYCTCANSVTSDPCIVCGKPKFITREWFERRAAAEGDLEIGAGSPSPAPAVEPVGIKALLAEIERLQFALRQAPSVSHFHILAEAMAEVKATSDGKSDQAIADIVSGCIEEIAALHPTPTPVSAPAGEPAGGGK